MEMDLGAGLRNGSPAGPTRRMGIAVSLGAYFVVVLLTAALSLYVLGDKVFPDRPFSTLAVFSPVSAVVMAIIGYLKGSATLFDSGARNFGASISFLQKEFSRLPLVLVLVPAPYFVIAVVKYLVPDAGGLSEAFQLSAISILLSLFGLLVLSFLVARDVILLIELKCLTGGESKNGNGGD